MAIFTPTIKRVGFYDEKDDHFPLASESHYKSKSTMQENYPAQIEPDRINLIRSEMGMINKDPKADMTRIRYIKT